MNPTINEVHHANVVGAIHHRIPQDDLTYPEPSRHCAHRERSAKTHPDDAQPAHA
jgi:hypothetical protein